MTTTPDTKNTMILEFTRERFEELYRTYNRPEFIHPDSLIEKVSALDPVHPPEAIAVEDAEMVDEPVKVATF